MNYFRILLVIASFCTHSWASPPVPYTGKVAIDGVNFQGSANFTFEISDAQGTVHWRNGATPNVTISVSVTNGRYVVQLGGQGMNPLDDQLFLDQPELYLQVRFYRADAQQWLHLSPDQRITSAPHALTAELARNALVAQLAQRVQSGAITQDLWRRHFKALNRAGTSNTQCCCCPRTKRGLVLTIPPLRRCVAEPIGIHGFLITSPIALAQWRTAPRSQTLKPKSLSVETACRPRSCMLLGETTRSIFWTRRGTQTIVARSCLVSELPTAL